MRSIEKTHQKGALCVKSVHLRDGSGFDRLYLVQRSGKLSAVFSGRQLLTR